MPVSDYLFHALKKIHMMSEFKLVPHEPMNAYLAQLKPIVMAICPAEDREILAENLEPPRRATTNIRIGVAGRSRSTGRWTGPTTAASARKAAPDSGDPTAASAAAAAGTAAAARLGRGPPRPQARLPAAREARGPGRADGCGERRGSGGGIRHAASAGFGGARLRRAQLALQGRARTDAGAPEERGPRDRHRRSFSGARPLGTRLGRSGGRGRRRGAGLRGRSDRRDAPHHHGGGGSGRGLKRFHEMVKAGVDRFNEGSLPQAVQMLDLAEQTGCPRRRSTPAAPRSPGASSARRSTRRSSRSSPSRPGTRRRCAGCCSSSRRCPPEGLLETLPGEPKRDRRRLMLLLLEIHGAPAREARLRAADATRSARRSATRSGSSAATFSTCCGAFRGGPTPPPIDPRSTSFSSTPVSACRSSCSRRPSRPWASSRTRRPKSGSRSS